MIVCNQTNKRDVKIRVVVLYQKEDYEKESDEDD